MIYDVAIIGGGIAGLTTSEIFARSGFKVCLIEKNQKLCMESSGLHHEWFHFGSLYSIFLNNSYLRTLVGGIDDLFLYYRNFKNMNLEIDISGNLNFKKTNKKWFKSQRFKYLFQDPKYIKNIDWENKLKNFLMVHEKFKNYDWRKGEASKYIAKKTKYFYDLSKVKKTTINNINNNSQDFYEVDSYDCPMDSNQIISDLLTSYLSYSGKIFLGSYVNKIKKHKKKIDIHLKNKIISSKKIIYACGMGINKILKKKLINGYVSPLIIHYPNVSNENFIFLSNNKEDAINHITHEVKGKKYSLIGGGDFAKIGSKGHIKIGKKLNKKAQEVFTKYKKSKTHMFFGVKNEIKMNSTQKRNYLYHIINLGKNRYYINPGKFSLSFSLAINTFKKIVGHYPNPQNQSKKIRNINKYLTKNYHKNFISKLTK